MIKNILEQTTPDMMKYWPIPGNYFMSDKRRKQFIKRFARSWGYLNV